MKTTPPPPKDVLTILPELRERALTTVRLHPRRATELPVDQSKVGGKFLWPADEPWPICDLTRDIDWEFCKVEDQNARIPFTTVLQIRAEDVPELEFFPGTDLMQVLWAPLPHQSPVYVAKPFVYWRNSSQIRNRLNEVETSEHADTSFIPKECRLWPERVAEYPSEADLDYELRDRFNSWDVADAMDGEVEDASQLYWSRLSTAPGTKIGGHVFWIQSPEIPTCANGHTMAHLLTIDNAEFDRTTKPRWCPVEDRDAGRDVRFPALGDLDGRQFLFICRQCSDWPVASVFQR